ncbi:MAG: (S)-benzoin forming benzil reductase [Candidatus Delongbacteria bacterium]|nr:(S)-benzoin forming benzil reductase [Candidatus Delongbacteria bacterium]
MNYYIITSTSRGLGEAIAKKLLNKNNFLSCLSSTRNNQLIALSEEQNCNLHYIEFDLNKVNEIDNLMEEIFQKIDPENIGSINLINNAGTIKPIIAIEQHTSEEIINSFNVNLISPAMITSKFIAKTTGYSFEKRIINISSGASKKPYDGWSTYCSSKAALDMFTQSVSVEQNKKEFPVKIVSFDPGIIDTDMHNEIRESNVEDFSQLERFIDFKEKGSLLTVEFVADKLIKLLEENSFVSGEYIRIWDMSK